MEIDKKMFGAKLRALRKEKHVSAREMSLALGMSESFINRIECGRSYPSFEIFFEICRYFDMSPTDFFSMFQEDFVFDMKVKNAAEKLMKMGNDERNAFLTLIDSCFGR